MHKRGVGGSGSVGARLRLARDLTARMLSPVRRQLCKRALRGLVPFMPRTPRRRHAHSPPPDYAWLATHQCGQSTEFPAAHVRARSLCPPPLPIAYASYGCLMPDDCNACVLNACSHTRGHCFALQVGRGGRGQGSGTATAPRQRPYFLQAAAQRHHRPGRCATRNERSD